MQKSDDRERFWPALNYRDWRDTATTLHLWTQIVGKVRLALTPWLNHGWHVPLYVNVRGLGTSAIHADSRHVRDRLRFRRPSPGHPLPGCSRARLRPRADVGRDLLSALHGGARRGRHRGHDQRDAERGSRPDPLPRGRSSRLVRLRRQRRRSGVCCCKRIAPFACSAPPFWARRARCTSSGAASTSPSPASRGALHRRIPRRSGIARFRHARGLFARGQQCRLLARQ